MGRLGHLAGARSPIHRYAAVIAASRFITGAHYVSDVLLGGAVGFGTVALMQIVFYLDIGVQFRRRTGSERE